MLFIFFCKDYLFYLRLVIWVIMKHGSGQGPAVGHKRVSLCGMIDCSCWFGRDPQSKRQRSCARLGLSQCSLPFRLKNISVRFRNFNFEQFLSNFNFKLPSEIWAVARIIAMVKLQNATLSRGQRFMSLQCTVPPNTEEFSKF